ncbi:MAG: FprA family A-type flavoprotein [Desulfuromonadales bacterium]|nr:FprA family A-type flavoprotein [Desulfuromonadales bacterium]NIR33608.1 FprA family A-type flavoprotein [Desulfuromonadales bacterium]NIS39754.1 FprA family A-type flavoprotein [Desulfuromonadales bacterium]
MAPEKVDIVVINHTEPDHSGALEHLLRVNPDIEVCITRAGENFLRQLLNHPVNARIVGDGEEIDLGGRTLRFILAPNMHWPDTMFTYLKEDGLLFSCDAFGAHYCPDEGLYNDEVPDFSAQFSFYFQTIMRPFKSFIRDAVDKLDGLDINMICPSHGPLLREKPLEAVAAYRRWSAAPPETNGRRVLLLTLSPHGNTRNMAGFVRQGLESRGMEVVEQAIYGTADETLRDEIECADALVVGTPTINRDAPPPVWHALSLLSTVTPKGRNAAVFGSYGWSGEAVKLVEERLRGLKYKVPVDGLWFRFKPTGEDEQACRSLGEQFAEAVLDKS